MSAPTRIYIIRNTDTAEERLVRATNASQALAHVVRTSYVASVASQDHRRIEIEDSRRESDE